MSAELKLELLRAVQGSGLPATQVLSQLGIARSTYYRWVDHLKDGIPKEIVAEKASGEKAES